MTNTPDCSFFFHYEQHWNPPCQDRGTVLRIRGIHDCHVWRDESHGLDRKARSGELGPRLVRPLEQPAIQTRQTINLVFRITGEQNGEGFLTHVLAAVQQSNHMLYGSAIGGSVSPSAGGEYKQGTNYRFHTPTIEQHGAKNLCHSGIKSDGQPSLVERDERDIICRNLIGEDWCGMEVPYFQRARCGVAEFPG
jgi:hypothetical protein